MKCHARKKRVLWLGPDHPITSGPAANAAPSKGRIHGCTERFAQMSDFPLATRAPSIHGTSATSRGDPVMSASGGEEVVSQTSAEVRVWTLAHAAKPYADIVCSAACLYVQRALVLATVNHWRDIYIIRRILSRHRSAGAAPGDVPPDERLRLRARISP